MNKKVIIINLLLLIVLLIICDIFAGYFFNRLTPQYGRTNVDILLNKVDTEKLLNEKPHPYLLWENTAEFISGKGIKQTNKQGYRNERDIGLPAPDTLRILTLGGSTTYGYLLDGPGDAWSAQLEKSLNARLGNTQYKRVEVVNGGLNFATSAELLSHYLFRDRYLQSKIVILHTGENDIVPLLFDDYNPEYTHFRPGWQPQIHSLRGGERRFVKQSNIIKILYAHWLNDGLALPYINKQSKPIDSPEDFYIENVKKNQPVGFERNLDLLIRNIIADGAKPVLVSPVMPSEKQFNELKGESAQRASVIKNMQKAGRIGLEKDKEVLRKLSKQYHIPLIQIEPDQIPTEYFLDHIHLSKEGEAIKAAAITSHILKILQF